MLCEWAADAVLIAGEAGARGASSPVPHAVRLLAKGLMSRAALHLSSQGSADPSDPAVRAQMCAKAPKRVVNIPEEFVGMDVGELELDLCEAMRRLKPMAGVGCDGMRNEYLTALVRAQDRTGAVKLTE